MKDGTMFDGSERQNVDLSEVFLVRDGQGWLIKAYASFDFAQLDLGGRIERFVSEARHGAALKEANRWRANAEESDEDSLKVERELRAELAELARHADHLNTRIVALDDKLGASEKHLADAKGLLEAFVLALRSGATSEEILAEIRNGCGLTKEPANASP